MDNTGYISLTRQTGLRTEMQTIAHNIANLSTTGFRREGVIFSEFVQRGGDRDDTLSIAHAGAARTDLTQGAVSETGGIFDLAIAGDGFFLLETAAGQAVTRAGAFLTDADGQLSTPDGALLLDQSGAPITLPPEARDIHIATDGTISADGRAVARVGLVIPADPSALSRTSGVRFLVEGGVDPVDDGQMRQGFLEGSNVDPIREIARMIEVQHAYEYGRGFLDREDERLRSVLQTLGR